jgi:hypothetical protein
MNRLRMLTALTCVNLALFAAILLLQAPRAGADAPGVLRGSALEIVDAQGRVRASIKLHPAEVLEPAGRRYPETVVLRLVDENGRPEVKIAGSVEGGGLALVGASDETRLQLAAQHAESSITLANGEGRRQVIRP